MTFEPRRVPAGTTIGFTDFDGSQVELESKAVEGDDDYHFIRPTSQLAANVLDSLEAPVARKVIELDKKGEAKKARAEKRAIGKAEPKAGEKVVSLAGAAEATSAAGSGSAPIETTAGEPATTEGAD
jgi:peptidoglycan hydrolase CwlO-like protein